MIGILLSVISIGWTEESKTETDEVLDVTAVPEVVWQQQNESQGLPIGQRMRQSTESLLGLPYILNGIGELQEPDLDPFVRYDGFDCLTFIEEAMALALASDLESLESIRLDLRYHDLEHTYSTRNHFMISQWIH